MKKLLIYFPEEKLFPKGGQAGYLFNLKKGLDAIGESEYLPIDISFYNNGPSRFEDNSKLRNMMPERILEIRRAINDAYYSIAKIIMNRRCFFIVVG
ncbi:hypothetical protein, partial [Enterocloster clostridioformis]